MKYVHVSLLAVALCVAAFPREAGARIIFTEWIDGGDTAFFVPRLDPTQRILDGSFLLLFDVGSVALTQLDSPVGWAGTVELASDSAGFPIEDDPTLPNVRFTYEGDPIEAPISLLGDFILTKTSEGIFAESWDYLGYAQEVATGALVYNAGVASVVPEPSTLALCALGLGGLAARARRASP